MRNALRRDLHCSLHYVYYRSQCSYLHNQQFKIKIYPVWYRLYNYILYFVNTLILNMGKVQIRRHIGYANLAGGN